MLDSPPNTLPAFSKIKLDQIEPQLSQLLTENRAQIAKLLTDSSTYTWKNLAEPLEELQDRLSRFWSPISNLNAVAQSPELRVVYNNCLPLLTAYATELEQNETLYQAYLALEKQAETLDKAQQKTIQDQLRDFRLAGVALPSTQKQRYAAIQTRLAELATKFEENILDATESWTYHTEDKTELTGIPAHVLEKAHALATEKKLTGWVLTLDMPCYLPVMSYADNRALREKMYTAYVTRASDQGPQAGRFDNSNVMTEILSLKQELSTLLGMQNYAEYSLATKMVKQPTQVLRFLTELVERVQPRAVKEIEELKNLAHSSSDITELAAWDVGYYSEKLREKQYGINDELLRPYFPIDQVLHGMFALVQQLYGMQITENKNIDGWHPDVRFFTIHDAEQQLRGQFYLDLYARNQKRGGAWMDDCHDRRRLTNGTIQTPVAYLVCNLTPPGANTPALLTHDEVHTLFHEFGHGLHHMLTQIDYSPVSGIHGVAWDAVELPSQFMEFFLWEKPVIDQVSKHYQTGEHLPDELFQRLLAAKNFHSALALLRQLQFALFDFRLHLEFVPSQSATQVQKILDEIRKTTSALPTPKFNRFQHSFSHIFAGGYAAGYYSYLWAEMLASDAFAKFQEEGIFNPEVGLSFLKNILEKGGSDEALNLFIAFRGREPKIDALLKQHGIDA